MDCVFLATNYDRRQSHFPVRGSSVRGLRIWWNRFPATYTRQLLGNTAVQIHSIAQICFAWVILLTAQASLKAQNTAESSKSSTPRYPRINTSMWYEVDPHWPQKPADFEWKAMPGVAVDRKDQVWAFTRSTPPVQVYSSDGRLVRAWGQDTIKTAHHIKIDRDENIWIADIGNHVVRKFNPAGQVLMTLGTVGEPGADESHLNQPTDMAIAANGDVFVSDGYGNNRVVQFNARGKFVRQWGSLGTGPNQFSLPHAIAIDSAGRLYVADRNNVRVQVFDQRGKLLDSWRNLIVPWGFWVTPNDEIWVCGASPMTWRDDPAYPGAPLSCPPKDQILMRFNTQGKLLQLWTIPKGVDKHEQPGDVNWIHAMAVDSSGNIYVADIIGQRVQKFIVHRPPATSSP